MEIPFPASTAPSINPTENGGRVINAMAEKAPEGSRGPVLWRRAPGLQSLTDVGEADHRGAFAVANVLFVANGEALYSVIQSAGPTYTVGGVTGTLPGSGPIMSATNMRAPNPQTLIVHSEGLSLLEDGEVSDFSDEDLPSINSITFMDGFFIVTSADGRAFASGLNDVTFSELDFATAEASVDGLVRAITFGRDLLLMGETTTEFWGNTGNPEGFPFSRGPVIPVGLFGRLAVTGMEYGFPAPLCWVGNDKRVYRLNGYSPEPISTPHLERLIERVSDPDAIEASCYMAAGHACYVFTGPDWTFVYDASTGAWHERQSYGADRWRARFSVFAFREWLTFDRSSRAMYLIKDRYRWEGDQPLVWELWSNQAHRFPARFWVKRASFDFVTGVGRDRGIEPIETDPQVSISWSNDGGRTFGSPLLRRLGTQGELTRIDVRRIGLTGRVGRQWRLQVSDPVEVSFLGGGMDVEQRLP